MLILVNIVNNDIKLIIDVMNGNIGKTMQVMVIGRCIDIVVSGDNGLRV